MTIFIESILTPYLIARFNAINRVFNGEIEVWFQAKTDINRHWQKLPKIEFKYQILTDHPVRLMGKDLHTLHINPQAFKLLNEYKQAKKLKRVVSCGWDTPTLIGACLWCQLNKIDYTIWSGSTAYEPSLQRTLTKPLVRWLVSHADSGIAYGERSLNYLVHLGLNSQKIDVFLNSVDINFFKKNSQLSPKQILNLKKSLKIPEAHSVLLYVGQLIERKGVKELVTAFLALLPNTPTKTLLIIGQGPLLPELRNIIPEKYKKNIVFINHVEYFDLPKYYALSQAFILPSQQEVWGLVVNEAMACAKQVLVADPVGCNPDLVIEGKTGFTFLPTTEAIQGVLTHLDSQTPAVLKTMGQAAQAHIFSYSDEASAKKLLNRWQSL